MTKDTTHYQAHAEHLTVLHERLARERERLTRETGKAAALRRAWIAQTEREIESTMGLMGMNPIPADIQAMTDDELIAALTN